MSNMAKVFEINSATEKFIEDYTFLKDRGILRTSAHLVDLIGWNVNSMSATLGRKRNIPFGPLQRFNKFYESSINRPDIVNKYSLDQIMEVLKVELKESYGGLSKDEDGRELQTPYMVIGIVTAAFDRLK